MAAKAVLFDVDFTLIHPGPTFRGEGYQAFAARHGIEIDPSRFDDAVAGSAHLLDGPEDAPYNAEIFIAYTSHIIEQMGGCGPRLDACSREIYDEWAACQHFELYDDVPAVLRALAQAGIRIGLISNTQRCLTSFQSHFELQGLITGTVSSFEHGFMKPHPSIFTAALNRVGVRPDEAVMVGDSIRQDIEGALRAGMRAILLHRGEKPPARASALGVPVIRSLAELPNLVIG
jgi:HAD superfamily hydrolase (TIGR01662 family)